MSIWSLLPGKKNINYVKNPSFERQKTDSSPVHWIADGIGLDLDSVTQDFEGRSGLYAVNIQHTGPIPSEVSIYQDIGGFTPGDTITASVYVYRPLINPGDWEAKLTLSDVTFGIEYTDTALNIPTNTSTRLHVTGIVPNSGFIRVRLSIVVDVFTATVNSYWDSCMVELNDSASSYFDGEYPYCSWLGEPFVSASLQPYNYPGSGEPIDLLSTYGLKINTVSGFGSSGYQHITHNDAYGMTKLDTVLERPREVGITGTFLTSTQAELKSYRAALLKTLLTDKNVPKILRHVTDEGLTLDLPVIYSSGLEAPSMGGSVLERVGIRVTSYAPLPYDPLSTVESIDPYESAIEANYMLIYDKEAGFEGVVAGLPEQVSKVLVTPNGYLWAFVNDSTPRSRLYALDSLSGTVYSWRLVGTFNNLVEAVDISPNGTIAIGGLFTTYTPNGGGALARAYLVTLLEPVAGAAITTNSHTINGAIYGLHWADDSRLYMVGDFTTINAASMLRVASAAESASIDGTITSFTAYNQGTGPNARVNAIIVDEGIIYIGGAFTLINGVSKVRVAQWNNTTSEWDSVGPGIGYTVGYMERNRKGKIWATSRGNLSTAYMQEWNGESWSDFIGVFDLNAGINALHYDTATETLYIGGGFNTIVYPAPDFSSEEGYNTVIVYKNGVFKPLDAGLTAFADATSGVMSITGLNNKIYFGLSYTDLTLKSAAINVLNSMEGTAPTYPVIVLEGSGTLKKIGNSDSQKILEFNYTLVTNERLYIDTRPLTRGVYSSIRGRVNYALMPGYNLADLALSVDNPGIYIWHQPISSAVAAVIYNPTYYSFDGDT